MSCMIVKKKNPQWFPSENIKLKVGETIEITDPKALILNGDVIALNEDGVEVSAYELYGVVVKDEMEEFQQYLAMKKQEALMNSLKKEKEELESQLADAKEVTEEKKEEKSEMSFAERMAKAKADKKAKEVTL